ncbi:MAG: glycoside hydrolase family 3 C-terminal domain-containing protein [Lachnospiraceae bacterium]|nr:glycoside hydrolase family 3 C-terminal domain-containing protein [Lachnospiraceae bacterium]
MDTYTLDWKKYSALARQTAAEGCVLLRNENNTLPLLAGDTVAIFGRIQFDYYKCGTGSGGMVNVPYVRSILDGLMEYESRNIRIYEPLLQTYREWVKQHPFDKGNGWGQEPWSQEEMPLSDELVRDTADHSSAAVVIIGRTAGEDRDNFGQPGSYYLTECELDMLKKVCAAFPRTAVVLNTGNIISMKWVDEVRPGAVLCAWQGGMEGGAGVADVLCGAVTPCGKLADTIAYELEDYPSSRNFGSDTINYYQEDIYVGYRYFETFAPEKVQYPFGYGLSYTTFDITASLSADFSVSAASGSGFTADEAAHLQSAENAAPSSEPHMTVRTTVTNTGSCSGKEVVQVYVNPPQGRLGKPLRSLIAFGKTDLLFPGETETITLTVPLKELASYDDSGLTGHKNCFVLEQGTYGIYVGNSVRSAAFTGSFALDETIVAAKCQEAMAPTAPFERFRPLNHGNNSLEKLDVCAAADPAGTCEDTVCSDTTADHATQAPLTLTYESVPQRTVSPADRRLAHLPECLPYTDDQGYRLADVADGNVSMEEFLAQLCDEDLMAISRGEGMCSPKVTPGTASAFGGVTKRLQDFGIPAGCCADGPSGIRMDCGTSAFCLPNGTLLACTFNEALVTELFAMEGLELYANKIDALLGPGINIHRSPLNGRNFEYHSEDPYLTGRMAVAQVTGMDHYAVSGTMKHFCANNQEYYRHAANSVISERALREIYLKPFEMGVRSGHTRSIMTTYGPVNGIWTAGSYDLNTTILHDEWNYQGMVMTDWWAHINDEGEPASRNNLAAMVRAQNDVYMVTQDALTFSDNQKKALKKGELTRAELVRNAANICRFLIASPAMQRLRGTYHEVTHIHTPESLDLTTGENMEYFTIDRDTVIPLAGRGTSAGSYFTIAVDFLQEGLFCFSLTAASHGSELAQMSATLSLDNTVLNIYTWHGESGKTELSREKEVRGKMHYMKFYFSQGGLELDSLRIRLVGDVRR